MLTLLLLLNYLHKKNVNDNNENDKSFCSQDLLFLFIAFWSTIYGSGLLSMCV